MKSKLKIIIPIIIILGVTVWALNSLITRSYSGSDLDVAVAGGPIIVTNPSESSLPVRLFSSSPGTFTVASATESIEGRSTSEGTGRTATQFYDFTLPSGITEFTVLRGANINFVANSDMPLDVTVQPLNADETRTTLLITVFAILASLFFLSYQNGHRWISAARRQKAVDQAAEQETERQNFKRIVGNVSSKRP
ncbi:MAG: hypothetical protein CL607_08500 [Anaerolineaceae bacterium]|nr:hypothetical protein [Anaerolineaceae bacterium]